jgi:prepilin-type N-terminal cleavage/methylation domain-containing protein
MKKKGFTLIELMVVILIVGILAAASIPLMQGRIDKAKWSEACAMAGTIRSAVRVAYVEDSSATLTGSLGDETLRDTLGFNETDLTGTYFSPGDFEITDVSDTGIATVTASSDGSGKKPTAGSYVLEEDGDWVKD